MRNSLRILIVGLMVVALSVNPAAACHFLHGYWGGGCYAVGPVFYGYHCGYGGYGGYGCGGNGCGNYGCGYGCEVAAHGGACCGGCGPYGACGAAVHDEVVKEAAPAAPGEPTPREQEADRPVDDAAAPTIPPAKEQPEPPAEDLFNGREATPPPPAVAPPTAQPPAAEVPPVEAPLTPPPAVEEAAEDDLFGPPAETPAEPAAPAEPPPAEPADDLFGPLNGAENTPTAEPPAEETPAEEEAAPLEDTDNIFGASRRVLQEKGGLASSEMRVWVDNTGTYACRGRLVQFLDGHVRILKDNGRTTTVPLYRLSTSDLKFVNRQASARKAERFQTAQVTPAMSRLAN